MPRISCLQRLLLLLLIAASCPALAADEAAPKSEPLRLEKVGDWVIDPRGLVMASGQYGRTFNGTSFQQDGLASHAGWQYATWYDANRRLCVGRRKLPDGQWQRIAFDDYTVRTSDVHNVPTLGICGGDGTIHLSWDHHASPLHYRVSRPGVATQPDDVEWSAELFGPVRDNLLPKQAVRGLTYPRFLKAPAGGLQLIYRAGGSGNGDWHLADYDPTKHEWVADGVIISQHGTYQGSTSRCGYLNDPRYDAHGRLVLTFCWREAGNPLTNHDLLFASSADRGVTWIGNDGNEIGRRGKQPLSLETKGLRVWEIPMSRGLLNSNTTIVDSAGRVHVVNSHMPDDQKRETDWLRSRSKSVYFHYWRDADGKWHRTQMDMIGSRPKLWLDKHDNAFLVFNTGGKLTVAAARAESKWSDWRVVHTEPGKIVGEPLVDPYRADGFLSIYAQEEVDKPADLAAPLRVIDLRPVR